MGWSSTELSYPEQLCPPQLVTSDRQNFIATCITRNTEMSALVGVLLTVFFYVVILCLGLWAARKFKLISSKITVDDVMLANRSIGLVIGSFTMTATWVGGNFIAGTTEVLNSPAGLIWCQAPLGYAMSLLVGGRFFVSKMRNSGYRTMMDPFLWKYGDIMHCLLYLPALVGDITWSAGILNALASSLKVVLHLKTEIAITLSAAFACCYTLLGGMYAIAYTDVLQVICLSFGLWLCLPFVLTNEHIESITENTDWVGELTVKEILNYIDTFFLIIFGGLPWQVYWQRVLAAKSGFVAKRLSYIGAVGCILMAVPAALIGAAASNAHWNETDYKLQKLTSEDTTNTLPLVMLHFCPPIVTFIGLGAIAAGVMSSTDSSLLSSSGMLARNIVGLSYFRIFKEKVTNPVSTFAPPLPPSFPNRSKGSE
ncbi:hypothetical protein Btru_025198 [Bulinus truncatus]|nr:hypothetical protein Btru_025198 [Bulinus truncatus]